MVVYILLIKADLEGVASVALKQQAGGANFCISVRNPMDHTEVRERVVIEFGEAAPAPTDAAGNQNQHHHGQAKKVHQEQPSHFALKWQGAQTRSSVRVLSQDGQQAVVGRKQKPTRDMLAVDSGTFVPMLALECDGVEPYAFHGAEFIILNKAGVQFDPVDLSASSAAWKEYDRKLQLLRISQQTILSKFDLASDHPASLSLFIYFTVGSGTTSISNLEAKFE
jgi:hypothetical protein